MTHPLHRRAAIIGLAAFACARSERQENPQPAERAHGFRRDPSFVPAAEPEFATGRSALRTEGEVIVLEGGPRFVTSGGPGSFGLLPENQRAIVAEVLSVHPDVFDTIQVYLSFLDEAHVGTAYYEGISNQVAGIGRRVNDGRSFWGLSDVGRLSGFSNMNLIDQFGPLEEAGRARSRYHAVIAQELSHRWLFYMTFRDETGADNSALLGRDDAHWSRLAQSNGSVQDGIDWRDNGDGTFTALGQEYAFAPLDLYAMGIYRPDQVPPLFYLVDPTLDGMPITEQSRIPSGARIRARKVEVTIDQIIASLGPRNPPAGTETPYYRAAFVLLTAPGQRESEWRPYLETLQAIQQSFPETYEAWTSGAGAICTKVTERCPEPLIDADSWRVSDGGDDLVAPGERFDLHLRVRNDGLGTAEGVLVRLEAKSPGVTVETATISAPPIAEAAAVDLGAPFSIRLDPSIPCGTSIELLMTATTREGPRFRREISLVIGNRTLDADAMNEGFDWTVDPEGDDDVTAGAWEIGEPELITVYGIVTQPAADHSPGEAKLAFHTGPKRGSNFSVADVDGGKTTLESPIFSIAGAIDPSLVFYAWFVAEDFAAQGGPKPVAGAALTVLGSNDGGATWIELASITERTSAWQRTTIRLLPELPPTNRMRFRFHSERSHAAGHGRSRHRRPRDHRRPRQLRGRSRRRRRSRGRRTAASGRGWLRVCGRVARRIVARSDALRGAVRAVEVSPEAMSAAERIGGALRRLGGVIVAPRRTLLAIARGEGSVFELLPWMLLVSLTVAPYQTGQAFLLLRVSVADGLSAIGGLFLGRMTAPLVAAVVGAMVLIAVARMTPKTDLSFDRGFDACTYALVPHLVLASVGAALSEAQMELWFLPHRLVKGNLTVIAIRIAAGYGWSLLLFAILAWDIGRGRLVEAR
jgi:hypothetical protein